MLFIRTAHCKCVTGNGDILFGRTCNINFKSAISVVYVESLLVICKTGRSKENADTGTTRAVFGIGIHRCDNISAHFGHLTVRADTVVNVNGADRVENSDADSVVTAGCGKASGQCRKCSGIVGPDFFTCDRIVRNLRAFSPALLVSPYAKKAGFFKTLGQIFDFRRFYRNFSLLCFPSHILIARSERFLEHFIQKIFSPCGEQFARQLTAN